METDLRLAQDRSVELNLYILEFGAAPFLIEK